jgi:hypothetical protein
MAWNFGKKGETTMSDTTGTAQAGAAEAEVNKEDPAATASAAEGIKQAASDLSNAAKSSSGALALTDATSAKDIISTLNATPEQSVAIVDLSTAIKSASNTADQVSKAETQSLSAQTGAQVANGNAVSVLKARFDALVKHVGADIAADVKIALAKIHDAEEVVENVFKGAGA